MLFRSDKEMRGEDRIGGMGEEKGKEKESGVREKRNKMASC